MPRQSLNDVLDGRSFSEAPTRRSVRIFTRAVQPNYTMDMDLDITESEDNNQLEDTTEPEDHTESEDATQSETARDSDASTKSKGKRRAGTTVSPQQGKPASSKDDKGKMRKETPPLNQRHALAWTVKTTAYDKCKIPHLREHKTMEHDQVFLTLVDAKEYVKSITLDALPKIELIKTDEYDKLTPVMHENATAGHYVYESPTIVLVATITPTDLYDAGWKYRRRGEMEKAELMSRLKDVV